MLVRTSETRLSTMVSIIIISKCCVNFRWTVNLVGPVFSTSERNFSFNYLQLQDPRRHHIPGKCQFFSDLFTKKKPCTESLSRWKQPCSKKPRDAGLGGTCAFCATCDLTDMRRWANGTASTAGLRLRSRLTRAAFGLSTSKGRLRCHRDCSFRSVLVSA